MIKILTFIKNQFEKIKEYFSKENITVSDEQNKKIVIRTHNDPYSLSIQDIQINETIDAPKITIRGVNERVPIASGTNVYRSEAEVQNANIGHGITVKKQRKPGRCPNCATRGEIVENSEGNQRWKCPVCNYAFN